MRCGGTGLSLLVAILGTASLMRCCPYCVGLGERKPSGLSDTLIEDMLVWRTAILGDESRFSSGEGAAGTFA